jgi:hemoglobin/transferrin/lactoferrin receptor protein
MSNRQAHLLKTRAYPRAILLILTAAGNPVTAQSTDKPKTDDPPPQQVTSREVVVTATRTERELLDVPTSISIVDIKQLERRPKSTIAQLLQDISGIQVTDGGIGGGAKRVTIRGEGPARVLVLIDGMKISEQKSMDGSMIMIDPNNVERIEVIKGPASVLYGSEAIGGVVNIITKKGGSTPIQGTQTFTWDGSNGALIPYTSLYGRNNNFSYRVSGDYTDAGDKVGASGRIDNSGYLQRNWSAYMDYAMSKGKMGVGYDHYWSSNRVPGVLETEQETIKAPAMGGTLEVDGISTTSIELDLPEWRRDRYYAFFELEKLSDTLRKLRISPFIQKTKKDFANDVAYSFEGKHSTGVTVLNDVNQYIRTFNDQVTYGVNLQTDWTFGSSHYVIGGVDCIYDDLNATSKNPGGRVYVWVGFLPGDNPRFPDGLEMTNQNIDTSYDYFYKGSQQTIAAYVQDEWSLHSDLTATIGLRWTSFNSELIDTDDDNPDHKIEARSDSGSNLVGSAGIVYSGIQDWRLRALVSSGYRYPLLNQLYVGTGMGSAGYCYPNPELKPETSNNFEVGARYDAHGLRYDLGVFYTTAENYITIWRVPDKPAGSPEYTFDNVESSKTYGAELTLSYAHQPTNLTPYLSGTWISRKFNRGGDLGETDRTGLPKWNGNAGLRYERSFSDKINFHADAYGRFTASSEEDQINGSTLNILSHDGWSTLNLALGVRGSIGKNRSYTADLNLNNIFNKSYIPAMSTLEDPGFNVVLRAGINF